MPIFRTRTDAVSQQLMFYLVNNGINPTDPSFANGKLFTHRRSIEINSQATVAQFFTNFEFEQNSTATKAIRNQWHSEQLRSSHYYDKNFFKNFNTVAGGKSEIPILLVLASHLIQSMRLLKTGSTVENVLGLMVRGLVILKPPLMRSDLTLHCKELTVPLTLNSALNEFVHVMKNWLSIWETVGISWTKGRGFIIIYFTW